MSDRPPLLGVITGMVSEAECLADRVMIDPPMRPESGGLVALPVGGDARRLKAVMRQLIEWRCDGILSFGIAAGLDRVMQPGELLLAPTVELPTGDLIPVSRDWRKRLRDLLKQADIRYVQGPLVGVDQVVADPEAKMRLHAVTAAMAADMESHIVAYEARQAGIPFVVLRAIADPSDRGVPAIAADALTPEGEPRTGLVLRRLIGRPDMLPGLLRIASDTRRALRTLRRVGQLDEGWLGCRAG